MQGARTGPHSSIPRCVSQRVNQKEHNDIPSVHSRLLGDQSVQCFYIVKQEREGKRLGRSKVESDTLLPRIIPGSSDVALDATEMAGTVLVTVIYCQKH